MVLWSFEKRAQHCCRAHTSINQMKTTFFSRGVGRNRTCVHVYPALSHSCALLGNAGDFGCLRGVYHYATTPFQNPGGNALLPASRGTFISGEFSKIVSEPNPTANPFPPLLGKPLFRPLHYFVLVLRPLALRSPVLHYLRADTQLPCRCRIVAKPPQIQNLFFFHDAFLYLCRL